jgi:hypothetical protein
LAGFCSPTRPIVARAIKNKAPNVFDENVSFIAVEISKRLGELREDVV